MFSCTFCLAILFLMESFKEQKFLILRRSNLLILFFYDLCVLCPKQSEYKLINKYIHWEYVLQRKGKRKRGGGQGVVMLLFVEDGQKRKETFEPRLGGSEGECHKNIWGNSIRSKEKSICKRVFFGVFEEKQGGHGGCKGVRKGKTRK